jgi:hypothetical protein
LTRPAAERRLLARFERQLERFEAILKAWGYSSGETEPPKSTLH